MTANAHAYLDSQKLAHPNLASDLEKIEALYSKKLWHQLTVFLVEFFDRSEFNEGQWLLELYRNFVTEFEAKLNQLSLFHILLRVSPQLADNDARIAFWEEMITKVEASKGATVACEMVIADLRLQNSEPEACRALLEAAREVLEQNDTIGLDIHARYYKVSAAYWKMKGSFSDYYREALRYLGCVQGGSHLKDLPEYAFDLALAAILSPDLYNFGELITHPVLQSLKGTPREWVAQLIFAFNKGDIAQLEVLQPYWQSEPLLVEHLVQLRKKMCLMTLMEIVFARPSANRVISFDVIAKDTRLPINEVEYLVMRALNLKLIRGTIDEVTKTV
eukprot:Ihof_evm4s91 gene=Ihof_evmTU4s91